MFLFFPDDLLFLKAVLLLICATQVLSQFAGPNEAPSSSSSENGEADAIQQLVAEPDYRAVRLRWQYLTARRTDEFEKENRPLYFIIRYCELAQWQSKKRCKEQRLPVEQQQPPPNEFKQFRSLASGESDDAVVLSPIRVVAPDRDREEHRAFQRLDLEVTLANLRMLTKYSVGVRADSKDVPGSRISKRRRVSAKTSRCLANSSVIEVHTGPYFGGKISVEGAGEEDAARCARFGNRSSSQATYTLAIDHQLCGSKIINKTRIETMVIVHENRDILTHNSRRYLVLCTFTPQLYSLTASASVPSHLLRKVFIDRLRERRLPFRLELLKTTKAEKKLKKRHSSSSSNNTAAKQSLDGAASLRDSRMIAEGSGDEKGRKNISIQEDQTESNLGSSSAVPVVSSSSPSSSSTTSSAVAISTIFCLSAATAALAAFLAQKRSSSSSSSNEATFSRKEEEEEDSSKLNEKISVVVAAAVMEA
ncbi:hypothetical protein TYRP_003918 [Tyrophagus putrescentiae]|nr:hypothetical protein TYRP_003918 [Tyrophagus putrescentiae]